LAFLLVGLPKALVEKPLDQAKGFQEKLEKEVELQ
jgi:hypothetical protein